MVLHWFHVRPLLPSQINIPEHAFFPFLPLFPLSSPTPFPFRFKNPKVNTGREAQSYVMGVHGEPLESFLAFKVPWFFGQLTYQMS